MRKLLRLFCYLLVINNCLVCGQNDGGCSIDEIGKENIGQVYVLTIQDTQINTNVLSSTYNGDLDVQGCTGDTYSYFNVSNNETHFFIDSTAAFGDFDKNTPKMSSRVALVTLECTFVCTSSIKQIIQIQVNDTNNHDPEFLSTSYEFKVPTPIMPLTDFTAYGEAIVATDIDFSNQDVTFKIEPDDFSITTRSTSTSKNYTASFSSKRILQLTDSKSYTITATDSGSPTRTASTTLTITVDTERSLDYPSFSAATYTFNYTDTNGDGIPILKPSEGPIILTTIKASSISSPTLNGEFSNNFKVLFNADTSTVDISITEALPATTEPFLILTLSVSTDNTASTSIIVYLSEESNEPLHFSNHYYTGSYDDVSNQVVLDSNITVTSVKTPNVSLSGDFADHFNVKYDEKTSMCQLSIKSNLTATDLKGLSYITIQIKAQVDESYDTSAIILSLPIHALKFTEALYNASYSDNEVVIDGNTPISFSKEVSDVSFVVYGTYSTYFKVKQDSGKNQYIISSSLPEDVLKEEREIVLTLTATDTYGNEAQTVVTIQLPQKKTAPKFTEEYYIGTYPTNGSGTIGLDKAISFTGENSGKIQIELESYKENFAVSYNSGEWVVTVKDGLNETVISENTELVIVLSATEDGSAEGHSILVIELPTADDTKSLKFEKPYYVAEYPKNGTGTIEFNDPIKLINVKNISAVSITAENFTTNFQVIYSNRWYIKIEKSLDESVLERNTELVITLVVKEKGNENTDQSVLVLQLPSFETTKSLKFDKAYYVANYPKNNTGVIYFEPGLKIENIDSLSDVTISLDTYTDNFEIKYDKSQWYINIKKSLDGSILNGNVELLMTLTAKDVNGNEGVSALVIKLPTHANGTSLHFSKPYYLADYPQNQKDIIEFETPIEFINAENKADISIRLDNYSDNFEIKYDSNRWYLKITHSLNNDVIQENMEIVMAMIATESENEAESALVLRLPVSANNTAPTFSSAYYLAKYPEEGSGIIEFQSPVNIMNVEDQNSVTITLDNYTENFDIKYESNRWYINIVQKIDDYLLHDDPEIVMTLTAVESGNLNKGTSALVLQIPQSSNDSAPTFSAAYYSAKYVIDDTQVIEFQNPIEFTNADSSSVTIIVDKYSDYLEVQYDKKWYIHVKNPLDENLVKSNSEILLTLTATTPEYKNKGQAALFLKLPSQNATSSIRFKEAYYLADYPQKGSGSVDFYSPIEFENVLNKSAVTITLDKYTENFDIVQDSTKWFLYVKIPLNDSILNDSELVMTLTASEKGIIGTDSSALVLKLPRAVSDAAPEFSKTYYLADYPESGKGEISLEEPISLVNVDPATVNIYLDKYTDHFEIIYPSNNTWAVKIRAGLDNSTLANSTELVMTVIAQQKDNSKEGHSVLVLRLPSSSNSTTKSAPAFSRAYYIASYPSEGSGKIAFEEPVSFENVAISSVTLNLDNYRENFELKLESEKWYINIVKGLNESVLNKNAELVMTLEATEKGYPNIGYSALVLKLPTAVIDTAPEFVEAYYVGKYPETGKGTIELENPIRFSKGDETAISIALDNYVDNFQIKLESEKWYINIINSLNESVLNKNAELVMALEATEKGNPNIGYSALVLKLPTAVIDSAPEFADAYYIGNYPETGKGTIELENPISFSKGDENAISIALDNYTDYFEINQTTDKHWIIKIKKSLENETMLGSNRELVMTMTATEAGNKNQGYSALVIELPEPETKTSPEFSETYYLADYPSKYTGVIEFVSPIKFENIDDSSQVTIQLSNYTDNFAIVQDNGKWKIKIKQNLDPSVLNSYAELVMSLVATASEMNSDGYATLVLRLPAKDDVAPIFSSSYYVANYKATGSEATLVFEDPINITNKQDISNISLTVENYKDNFMVEFDSKNNSWEVKVKKQLSDEILLAKTDLVLALTATNLDNSLTDHAAIDLYLPSLNTEKAPKFSKTYYTAKYTISGDSALVTFDNPLNITNKQNLKDISISLDNYIKNFFVTYNQSTGFWQMNVISNLDQSLLNAKDDLVMALTATEKNNDEIGQAALVMRLPVINNDEAPKFSSIYYYGTYITGDHPTITLETDIEIKNKNNLGAITINFDDSYKENLEIVYEDPKWVLKVKSPLDENIFKLYPDLILTLTATETDNLNVGQAVLVLHLPVEETKLPPKFSLAHYSANYIIENNKASIILNDTITVVNKVDLSNISLSLDSFDDNFPFTLDPTNKRWTVSVQNPLLDEVVKSTPELVLTLTAKETDNENEGQSTLIISMPPLDTDEDLVSFSEIYYSGNYSSEGKGSVKLNEKILVATKNNTKIANVSIESENYADHFQLTQEGESYLVSVVTPLPTSVLETQSNLIMTLVAEVDDFKSYATLVINLPATAVNTSTIRFTEALYTATYENVDGKGTLNVNGTIQVETEDDGNVEPNIFNSDGYDAYFQIGYSNKVITVTLKGDEDIPTEVLRNNAFIPLILTIGIAGTTARASAVLNVEIKHENDEENLNIEFSNVLYEGKYEVTDGTVSFIVDGAIEIVTNATDGIVAVNITNEYASYFSLSYSNKVVTVNLGNSSLPSDVLASFSVIPLTMTAVIRETRYSSSAVLNINIKYDNDSETDAIDFSSVLYTGEYSIVDDKGKLVVNDIINVVTNRPDGDIVPTITDSDYKSYFHVSYSNKVVSVELIENLPKEIVERKSLVALTFAVGIKDTALSSSAVLNIHIDNDNTEDNRSIAFSNVLYNGKYEIVNNYPSLTIGGTISLVTNESDSNVVVTITNEFHSFFEIDYSKKTVTITLITPLTEETLTTFSVVPLTLQAQINGTSHTASAVLNLEIKYDRDGDHDSIQFTSVLYNGLYSVKDKEHKFKVDDAIDIITTASSNDVEAKISDDSPYRDYFSLSLSENKVSVKLIKILPRDAVERNSFLALTLTAGIKETIHNSSAVLNIAIKNEDSNDNDDDDTKTELHHWKITFTVVTAILCVLLIACIAGAIAYYFLRVRNDSYSNLEEDGSGRVRFGKNSLTRSPSSKKSSALEERRPTGFIFYPIDDDMVENTESPTDADKGRRKSVAFDDNVEKMQIDSVNDDENDVSNNEKLQVTHV